MAGDPSVAGERPEAEPERPESKQSEPDLGAEPDPGVQLDPAGSDPAAVAARRRRLAEVFGDVLPEATVDDQPDRDPSIGADERWYTENRPPHHGG